MIKAKITNFTQQELWFLFYLHTPAIIIGFPDPTLGFLADEVEAFGRQAQVSLLKKGIIKSGSNNQWVIHEPFAGWIRGIVAPTHSILIMRHNSGSVDLTQSYHFTCESIISMHDQESGEYVIGSIDTIQDIHEFLLEPFLTTVYCDNCETAITILEKDLARARSQIENGQIKGAKKILTGSFPVEEQLDRFIQAMSDPVTRLSLVVFINRDKAGLYVTKGFSVIAGKQDIWLLRPTSNELDCVQVSSISKLELEKAITTFLPQTEVTS